MKTRVFHYFRQKCLSKSAPPQRASLERTTISVSLSREVERLFRSAGGPRIPEEDDCSH